MVLGKITGFSPDRPSKPKMYSLINYALEILRGFKLELIFHPKHFCTKCKSVFPITDIIEEKVPTIYHTFSSGVWENSSRAHLKICRAGTTVASHRLETGKRKTQQKVTLFHRILSLISHLNLS